MNKPGAHPMVTFGLPTVNSENRLSVLLDSLLAQTYGEFKILISDNASTDGTNELCKEYAAKDGRITVFRQPERICMRDNFKFLLDKADTKYFSWQSDDDFLADKWLEKTFGALEADPSIQMVCTVYTTEKNGEVGNMQRNSGINKNFEGRVSQIVDDKINTWFFIGINGLWHTDHLKKTFGRLVEVYQHENLLGTDTLLNFNVVINQNFGFINEHLFTKRTLTDQRTYLTDFTYRQRYEQSMRMIDPGIRYMMEVIELSKHDESTKRKLAAVVQRLGPKAVTNTTWARRMKWRLLPWYRKKTKSSSIESSIAG